MVALSASHSKDPPVMLIYGMRFQSDKAEQMRLRAHYKRLALDGKLRGLSVEALKSMVGPDCAYHLYWAAGDPQHLEARERKPSAPEGT